MQLIALKDSITSDRQIPFPYQYLHWWRNSRPMIRQALTTDLDRICELGEIFFIECKLPGKFNPAVFKQAYTALMVEGFAEVWVLEYAGEIVGAIGGIFSPDTFTGDTVAVETFWYVHPKHRHVGGMKLFKTFIDRAQERDCIRIQMAAILRSPAFDNVQKFYMDIGMVPMETYFTLNLKEEWQLQPQPSSQLQLSSL